MKPSSNSPAARQQNFVNAEVLQGCLEAASELGLDLSESLRAHEIELPKLGSPKGFLNGSQVCAFLESVANQNNCPHFGFVIAKHQPAFRFGPGRQLLQLSPTLLHAAEHMRDFIEIYTETSIYDLLVNAGYATIRRFDRDPALTKSIQLRTLGVMQLLKACKSFCGARWSLESVHFRHAAPPQAALYSRHAGCPVEFNSDFDGIRFPEHLLHLENEASDPELYAIVLAHCEKLLKERRQRRHDDIQSQVRLFIRQHLGTKQCNLEAYSEMNAISTRTLQRELASVSTTFRAIRVEERMRLARKYLEESDITMTELTLLLGYRNLSGFSRAFTATHGKPPQVWREARGAQSKG